MALSASALAGTYEQAEKAAEQYRLSVYIGNMLQAFGDSSTFRASNRSPERFDNSDCKNGCLGSQGTYYYYENDVYTCKLTIGIGYYYVTAHKIRRTNCCTKTAPAICQEK